ncbi:hypothetical protein [Xanthobacter sp. KR7-65]|uniref:hypothetical protein n=1 Tax=Xanthobacter sp. KR7-65 TaxID=3156612 RepID=UPI0032B4E520
MTRHFSKPRFRSIPCVAVGWRFARAAGAAAALTLLAACAGGESVPGLTPPNPPVPQVPENAFPTLGAPPADRREPLTPEGQAKLQRDLERLARTQSK